MRFVPVKSPEQQDLQTLHRVRQSLVKERTAVANQTRGLLGEYGLIMSQGLNPLRRRLPEILEDAENGLSASARSVFSEGYDRLVELDRQVKGYEDKIQAVYRASPVCQRLGTIPGVGPIIATAMVAAWLGIVPRQESSGGKPRLLGISKRGDTYLRTLLIHGSRSVVKTAATKDDAQSRWINERVKRRNANIAAVAVANKNARTIWALLTRDEVYRAPLSQAA